jgi:hypothetical protein
MLRACLSQTSWDGGRGTPKALHRPPRLPAPPVRAHPAVLPHSTPLALLLPTPPTILYDAYV